MNIGIIGYPKYEVSGVIASELGNQLANRGHNIHFFSYQNPIRLNTRLKNIFLHKINLYNDNMLNIPLYEYELISKILHICNKYSLNIIHAHYAIPHANIINIVQNILLKKGLKIYSILTIHGNDIANINDVNKNSHSSLIEYNINNVNAITVTSNYIYQKINNYLNFDKKIHIIPNFIDKKRFYLSEHKTLKNMIAPRGEYVLTHISNFEKKDTIEIVIKVFFNLIKDSTILLKLLFIGDGPNIVYAKKLCDDYKIRDYVYFLGFQKQIEYFYSISDLILLPYTSESLGLVILEAMSCGIPIISSDGGGLKEININGKTGYVSNCHNIYEMTKNILYILKNRNIYKTISQNAINYAKKFDINIITDQYEKLYTDLIS
ncbi:MAG: N-acetyl-alpha-D-glucosaminyl L-malate synthase BshA [Bacteroides sp.]|nr:MAG: N-acetyl-alpha-D-glucosaminyl L-malate synthase BshA [Bacteroides sp.]